MHWMQYNLSVEYFGLKFLCVVKGYNILMSEESLDPSNHSHQFDKLWADYVDDTL